MNNKNTSSLILFVITILMIYTPLYALQLSAQEKEYLQRNDIVKVGVIDNMPPLEYYGAGYKHQGIIADFLQEVATRLQVTLQYEVGSYEKLVEMVLRGDLDMLSYATKESKNENLFLFTDSFLEIGNSIFIATDNQTINHINDIQSSVLGIRRDSPLKGLLKEKFPNMGFRYADSHEEAFELIFSKEVEAYVGNSVVGDYLINRFHFLEKIKKTEIPWLRTPLRFAISKDRPVLRDLLQKAIADIDYKTHNKIVQKWLSDTQEYKKMPISFTKEENAWIESNPTLTIGASTEWKPLSYYDKGKIQGVTSGYLELISQKTGLMFQPKKVATFSQMLIDIKDKKLDMLDAIVASKERAEYMDFSNAYLSLDNIIAIRKGKEQISLVSDLKNKKVGIIEGYIVGKYLKQDVPKADIISYREVQEGLKALSSGDLDAFVLDLPMFDFYTAKYKISNLIVSANTPYSFPIHFAIKKDEKLLVSIINKTLDSIDEGQQNQIYRKWVSVKFSPKVDYTLIWKIIGIFLFFLLGTIYWNRKLSKEIEKRKIVESELVVAKEMAEDATKAKSIFLANMSHEIRTPMNSVIGFADLLDDLIKDPVQKGYLRSIKIGGKALLGIINDILDLSKIEAGQLKVVNESVNIHNLFLEMQQLFNDKINQRNLIFDISIEPDIPKYLILDGARLRQILLNLISNAIKFTEQGSVTLKVGKTFRDSEKSKLDLEFEVQDTGIGIPKDNLESIFETFVQRDKQSVKKYGGTGLGLSICKRLIEIMNGSMVVTSEVGVGTTFKVSIKDVGVSSLSEEPQEEIFVDVVFEPATLLVVDDIEENRALIKGIFANSALHVKEADNGQEAVEVVGSEKIDFIFMDLQMPILNGYEATLEIRKTHKKDDLPIIALTASVMGEQLEKVEQFGFNGYLRKPTSKQAIIQEVSKYLPCEKEDLTNQEELGVVHFDTQDIKDNITSLLNKDLFREWQEIKDKGDVALIGQFNEKLVKLLKLQNIDILKNFTDKMSVCIEGFDLVEMYNLLNTYPTLVAKIDKGAIREDV